MLGSRAYSAPSVLRSRDPAAEGPAWASVSSCPISSFLRPSRRRTMLTETWRWQEPGGGSTDYTTGWLAEGRTWRIRKRNVWRRKSRTGGWIFSVYFLVTPLTGSESENAGSILDQGNIMAVRMLWFLPAVLAVFTDLVAAAF